MSKKTLPSLNIYIPCITFPYLKPHHLNVFEYFICMYNYMTNLSHTILLRLFLPWGWSGSANVLGTLPVPGRPTILITVGQWPTALAVGAGGFFFFWTFVLSSILSLLFLPLFGRRPDID